MTCREHIINKFGEEKGEQITEVYCPSSFHFKDSCDDCCEGESCDECWNSEQKLSKIFDDICSKFDVESMKFIDKMSDREALEAFQQKLYKDLGVPKSVLDTDEMNKLCEKHREMMVPTEPHILDSGDRTEFESGAVRDMRVGKGRCDLLPLDVVSELMPNETAQEIFNFVDLFQESGDTDHLENCLHYFQEHFGSDKDVPYLTKLSTMLLEVAKHFEEGAKKYGDDNWKKGIPTNVYIDSAVRHYLKFLRGDKDEPHDRAFCWNILCCIWTCIHKPELNVYRKLDKGE